MAFSAKHFQVIVCIPTSKALVPLMVRWGSGFNPLAAFTKTVAIHVDLIVQGMELFAL